MYANPLMTNTFAPGQQARPTGALTPLKTETPRSGTDSPTVEAKLIDETAQQSDVYIPERSKAAGVAPPTTLAIDDVKAFVLHPAPRGRMLKLKLVRHEERIMESMYPRFELFLQEGPNLEYERFLLSARKRKKSKNANYLISLSRDVENMLRHDESYIGKVRGNFYGTTFNLYGAGENPLKHKDVEDGDIRCEYGAVLYQSNTGTNKGPRKMKFLIPMLTADGSVAEWKAVDKDSNMVAKHEADDHEGMICLENLMPRWNDEKGAFVMGIIGRRKMQTSVKNFQVVHPDDPSTIIMQFGKENKESFVIDVAYPLSVFQALGFALTSIDNKMSVC